MREYETVFITQPNLNDTAHKQLLDKLGTLIAKHNGHLFYARDMGKRSLAYPIGKQTKGTYTCLDYSSHGQAVNEIERLMRLDENVLRFLTVVKVEEVNVEARKAEIAARGEDKVGGEITEEALKPKAVGADDFSDDIPDVNSKITEEV